MQRGHLWLTLKEHEGAQKLVEKELDHALEASGRDVEEYEMDSEAEVGQKKRKLSSLACLANPSLGL